jgi:outer membrane protein OmpA-like peptidoglycan-associated protein
MNATPGAAPLLAGSRRQHLGSKPYPFARVMAGVVALVALAGCNEAHVEKAAPRPWTEKVAAVEPMSLEDILKRTARAGAAVSIGEVTAKVFERDEEMPNEADPEWINLRSEVVRGAPTALANGWRLEVIGYCDDTGSPDTNARKSTARARNSAALLAEAARYPADRIEARGAGVFKKGDRSGDSRKVVVRFIHD